VTAQHENAGVSEYPAANADLDINEAPDGLVIYDLQTNRVHYLNPSASAVFVLCTGDRDAAGVAQELQSLFHLADLPTEEVTRCLDELLQRRLIH
jgi:Coenzyme PQQ synthesis protein D (PqqD)